jgi:hypothetical protein
VVSSLMGIFIPMKIYKEKYIDVCVNGKLRMVSLNQLLRLIVAGKNPALTKQGHADFKKLIALVAQIQIQGNWLLQSPNAVPTEFEEVKASER